MKKLEVLEELYWMYHNDTGKTPVSYRCNEQTLDSVINELKDQVKWFVKSNEEMKEQGVRYRNVLFEIDETLEEDIIHIV